MESHSERITLSLITIMMFTVTVAGRWSFGGGDEGPHQRARVPGVRVEQGVVVGLVVARHPEGGVRRMTGAQLGDVHAHVTNHVMHALLDVVLGGLRMAPRYKHIES